MSETKNNLVALGLHCAQGDVKEWEQFHKVAEVANTGELGKHPDAMSCKDADGNPLIKGKVYVRTDRECGVKFMPQSEEFGTRNITCTYYKIDGIGPDLTEVRIVVDGKYTNGGFWGEASYHAPLKLVNDE